MNLFRRVFRRIEGRYLYLLVALVVFIFSYPYLDEGPVGRLIASFIIGAVPFGGIYACRYKKRRFVVSIVLGVPAVFTALQRGVGLELIPEPEAQLSLVAFYVFAIVTVMNDILEATKVTTNTIYGAVSVYLLLGVTWSGFYTLVEYYAPGSFFMPPAYNPDGVVNPDEFLYFSFVTLTTLGYGDMVPVSDKARSLAFTEAVSGVLFMAVLIARFIGIHISQRTAKSDD